MVGAVGNCKPKPNCALTPLNGPLGAIPSSNKYPLYPSLTGGAAVSLILNEVATLSTELSTVLTAALPVNGSTARV